MAEYQATRACSGCPHRTHCHPARKRAIEFSLELGRHTLCTFYRSFEQKRVATVRFGDSVRSWFSRSAK